MDSSSTADRIAPADSHLADGTCSADGYSRHRNVAVSRGIDRYDRRGPEGRGPDDRSRPDSRSPGDRSPDVYPADLLTSTSTLTSKSSPEGPSTASALLASLPSGSSNCGADAMEAAASRGWWLAHTLPRQEKALAAALYAREVPFYLPLVTRKSLSRGRTRVARIALFPGYVFICGNAEERVSVLRTNRVLTVRPAPDGERLRADLLRFFRLIEADAPLLPEARLIAGERVRVKAGPFRDQEGVVIRRNGKTRLLIAVDYLQQGASLEVDDCLLERV